MKNIIISLIAILFLGLHACRKTEEAVPSIPAVIDQVNTAVHHSFDTLNQDMASTIQAMALQINDTADIRVKMSELYNRSSFVMEFSYVTPQGIMQIVEPPQYHYIQGSDISGQDHIIKTFNTRLPALSLSFMAVENFLAVVDVHPVLKGQQMLGGVTALFRPPDLLRRIISPLVAGQNFEIWVMESGGTILYDQDEYEIGRNVLTDTLYTSFPELLAASILINSHSSGETSYSFYQTGTNKKVVKQTFWNTCSIFGTEWKIIWVKPVE